MNKKKIVLTVLAFVLVCALSVSATLAYLTEKANGGNGITNTFVAMGDGSLLSDDPSTSETSEGNFQIVEIPVSQDEKGNIATVTGTNVTGGIAYKLLPNTTFPKYSFVEIDGKTIVPATLFLEVVEDLQSGVYTWELDPVWVKLPGIVGLNGGDVYVYCADKTNPTVVAGTESDPYAELKVPIIKDGLVSVADVDLSGLDDSLEFYAYLGQANAGETPADTFKACGFEKPTTTAK